MGYCMSLVFQQFKIEKSGLKKALKAIQALPLDRFAWVPNTFVLKTTFAEAMRDWRWLVAEDKDGNIVDIEFIGEKLGDDMVLFKAIAPYVTKGSYIEMQGEDGMRWRWKFTGKTCQEIAAKITWDE